MRGAPGRRKGGQFTKEIALTLKRTPTPTTASEEMSLIIYSPVYTLAFLWKITSLKTSEVSAQPYCEAAPVCRARQMCLPAWLQEDLEAAFSGIEGGKERLVPVGLGEQRQ